MGLVRAAVISTMSALLLAACSQAPQVTPIPTEPPTSSAMPGLERFLEQTVTWTNCGDAECTHITVPLDYEDPDGRTIDLAATRVPATGKERLGSLLLNPGGPGASAFDYAKAADFVVGEQIRSAYDVVGVDPRGVGKSDPLTCLTNEQRDALIEVDGTPDDEGERAAIADAAKIPARECTRADAELAAHMGTVNVARDFDIVRHVLGDERLNFLGKSYGTAIGAVYAELFPERVGRMVLDGVLPPDLSLEEISLGQVDGFEAALVDFSRDCAEHRDCPFAGDGAQVRQSLIDALKRLDAQPLTVDGRLVNEAVASYAVLMYLYAPPGDYEQLRDGLNQLVNEGDASRLMSMLDARVSRGPDGQYVDNGTDAFYTVTCADDTTSATVDEVRALADEWSTRSPLFGSSLAYGLLFCEGWPTATPPVTQTDAKGADPILIVSTMHDPATPYAWGQRLAERLDSGVLLTWDGRRHTAYGEGSSCVDDAVDAYLLRGELPPEGTICQ